MGELSFGSSLPCIGSCDSMRSRHEGIALDPDLSSIVRASVFPFQKCVNSVSGFANSVFYRFRFSKFRFLPFQIFKIPFYFFQAVFLL